MKCDICFEECYLRERENCDICGKCLWDEIAYRWYFKTNYLVICEECKKKKPIIAYLLKEDEERSKGNVW